MTTETKISFNLKGLEKFRKQIGDQYIARVGILGDKVNRTGKGQLTNAEIGIIQLYGSVSRNIPPRDWLIMPIERNKRELTRAMQGPTVRAAFDRGDYKKIFQILGVLAEGYVQEGFATSGFGQWAPLKPATIRRKGSDKPLIDTAEFRKSVASDVVGKNQNKGNVAAISVGEGL